MTTPASPLLPCPFCTEVPELVHTEPYWVECSGCGCEGPYCASKKKAIELWNSASRPTPHPASEWRMTERQREALLWAKRTAWDKGQDYFDQSKDQAADYCFETSTALGEIIKALPIPPEVKP